MKLNKRLESTSQEVTALESSLAPYLSSSTSSSPDLDFLREKWDDLFSSWNRVDRSSENLRDELKEDAWLTVFRSASKQAEEMMESLEKVLSSAQEFVWEVGRRRKGKERMRGGEAGAFGEEEGEELMKAHQALVKSFDTKRKYYVNPLLVFLGVPRLNQANRYRRRNAFSACSTKASKSVEPRTARSCVGLGR